MNLVSLSDAEDRPDDAPALAPIEELDPDRGPRGGPHRRELLLGLLLLLGLSAFALGQWADSGGKHGRYQAAERAAAAHDWAAAATAYQAAGDYADAATRATQAAGLLRERQQQAAIATAAAGQAAWPQALAAAQRVLAITPGDPAMALIAARAQPATYAAALSGTVALRAGARQPGLYYFGAAGWRYLPDSDPLSRVRGSCPNGDMLYDAPQPGAAPAPAPDPSNPRAFNFNLAGRRLEVAGRDGTLRQSLALDPGLFNRYLCFPAGVWAIRQYGFQAPDSNAHAPFLTVSYQAFGSPGTVTPALPGRDWGVVGIAGDGRHLLLLEAHPLANGALENRLALANPDGTGALELISGDSTPTAVESSPDGRTLLFTQADAGNAGPAANMVGLWDMSGTAPVVPLLQTYRPANPFTGFFGLIPTFLTAGPRAGQVLLGTQAFNQAADDRIDLIDPAHPQQPVAQVDVANSGSGAHLVRQDRATGTLLISAPARDAAADAGSLILLDPAGRVQQAALPLPAGAVLTDAWLRAGRLVYASQAIDTVGGERRYLVQSLPLGGGGPAGGATPIYTETVSIPGPGGAFGRGGGFGGGGFAAAGFATGGSTVRAGTGLLAYLASDGVLHARTYDGALDFAVESGIRALYDLDADLTPGAATVTGRPRRFSGP